MHYHALHFYVPLVIIMLISSLVVLSNHVLRALACLLAINVHCATISIVYPRLFASFSSRISSVLLFSEQETI